MVMTEFWYCAIFSFIPSWVQYPAALRRKKNLQELSLLADSIPRPLAAGSSFPWTYFASSFHPDCELPKPSDTDAHLLHVRNDEVNNIE